MRTILVNAISLDGKIALSDKDELSWIGPEDRGWFIKACREAKVIIMGRKAYETLGGLSSGKLIKVMTKNPGKFKSVEGSVEFTSKAPGEVLVELYDRGYQTVVIGGGSEINTIFMKEKLVGEIWLLVVPIILGDGLKLIKDGQIEKQAIRFMGIEKFSQNGVILRYKVEHKNS